MRRRLVAVTLATTSMIALAFVLPLAVLVRDVARERAVARGTQVAASLAPVLLTGDVDALEVALTGVDPGVRTTVVLPDGERLGATLPDGVSLEAAAGGAASTERVAGADVLITPVIRPDVGTWVVVVAVPDDLQRRGVAVAWVLLGGLALVLVGGALVLADHLGRTVTRPAARMVETARRLADGDLDARVEVDGPPEVADVGRALNQLADRIDVLVRAEREAVADLSHRLRTPLTALRLDIEALAASAERERLADDLDAMERSVDRLIREARAGADAAGAVAVIDGVELARERAAWWAALADEQGRTTTFVTDVPEAAVSVSRDDLVDALDALIGNVFAHTPEGTRYAVEVTGSGSDLQIAVHDHGPGLPVAVGRTRGDSRAGSTGLGLDIARRVAASAGGRLELATDVDGARVVLVLPTVAGAGAHRPERSGEGTGARG